VKRGRKFLLLFLSLTAVLWGQSRVLEGELARLTGLLESPLPEVDRQAALCNLARLYHLAGDIGRAGDLWLEAAALGGAGGRVFLESLRFLIARGEFDQAGELALRGEVTLEGSLQREVVYLGALARAIKTGDWRGLIPLAGDPAFGEHRAPLYYALWQISGDDAWKDRLLWELPASPEAKIAGTGLIAGTLPHWVLFPGRDSIALAPPPDPAEGSVDPALPPSTPGEFAAPVLSPSPPGESPLQASPAKVPLLQVGFFRSEANARAMVERLGKAGFSGEMSLRGEGDSWAVLVPGGEVVSETILRLKDAGFEVFPLW